MSFLFWTQWVFAGLVVVILAAIIILLWIARDYFSLKGHFPVTDYLKGKIGTVKKECTPHQRGKVYVMGAYWDAISEFGSLHENEDIQVVDVRDKFLVVKRIDLVTGKQSGQ